jgi:CubicO group peptidase (beta-lactamase class C family)
VLSKGYGFADIEQGLPATGKTIYQIASVSKHIVAVCIMKLAEQGKLNLSDSVVKYFPDAPASWEGITIRHLLMLSSGLRRESPAFKRTEQQPLKTIIKAIYPYKPAFAPGSKWKYSNTNYFILASIMEQVTGESFEDYTSRFLAGIGLKDTTVTTRSTGAEKAAGYMYLRRAKNYKKKGSYALRPSGAFSSSIDDMLQWDAMLFESDILTKENWEQTYTDTIQVGAIGRAMVFNKAASLFYGYGWGVANYKGRRLLMHGGGNIGYKSNYWKFIDDKTSIIILCNTFGKNLNSISEWVYEIVEQMG